MKRFLILCALLVAFSASTARAAITPTGDVIPADPSTWDSSTTGYIGDTYAGTLTVDGGSGLLSYTGYIGNNSGSSGTVTVDGSGSTWSNYSGCLNVGYSGSGTLKITGGGAVTLQDAIKKAAPAPLDIQFHRHLVHLGLFSAWKAGNRS